jgi:hypothetical protein
MDISIQKIVIYIFYITRLDFDFSQVLFQNAPNARRVAGTALISRSDCHQEGFKLELLFRIGGFDHETNLQVPSYR